MKKIISLLLVVVAIVISSNAFAWFACTGIPEVSQGVEGSVYIRADAAFPGGAIEICSLSSVWKEVPIATCKAWFSQALAAQLTNKKIWIQYLDDTYSCATMPLYGAALVPYSIHIE